MLHYFKTVQFIALVTGEKQQPFSITFGKRRFQNIFFMYEFFAAVNLTPF